MTAPTDEAQTEHHGSAALNEHDAAALAMSAAEEVERLQDTLRNLQARLELIEHQAGQAAAQPSGGAAPAVGGVRAKVLQVMTMVSALAKTGTVKVSGEGQSSYKFRSVDAAMGAVGHAMRTVGLIGSTEILGVTSETNAVESQIYRNGQPTGATRTVVWTTARVTLRYSFLDPDTGERHPFEMVGEGRDAGDKATSKAASMALKYGLLQALMIPVEEMDDADRETPQIEQQRQRQQQTADPAAPPETSKPERAKAALEAIRRVLRDADTSAAKRHETLGNIAKHLRDTGLSGFEVEGATLLAHAAAARATLPPAEGQ